MLHVEAVAQWPNVAIQVLPFSLGCIHLMDGSLTLLWHEGRKCRGLQGRNGGGLLIDDSEEALRHRLSYDLLRDLALSPSDSLTFIRGVLEEHRS